VLSQQLLTHGGEAEATVLTLGWSEEEGLGWSLITGLLRNINYGQRKEIARDMLRPFISMVWVYRAVAKGVISLPVSLAYLGYDFIDTEHRRENQDDKFRLAALVKKVTFNDEVIYKVIKPFIDDFISHVDIPSNFSRNISGSVIGKMTFRS
jgi:hypothetical protein